MPDDTRNLLDSVPGLEPGALPAERGMDGEVLLSLAISAKRIADALERLSLAVTISGPGRR